MIYFNVQDKRDLKKLASSKRFLRYPNMFLTNTCEVRVNKDDYLTESQFVIHSKKRILPRKIYLYGKKTGYGLENNLYLNYWLEVFLKTVENGILSKSDFSKSESKLELCIGLPVKYREKAFHYRNWTKDDVITFLNCLFDNQIEETKYFQQNLLDDFMVA